jgi:hypothetical protein
VQTQRQAEHAEVGAHEGRGACVKTVVLAMAGGCADAGACADIGARADAGARTDARARAGACANTVLGVRTQKVGVLTQGHAQTEGHSRETCVCHSACICHNDNAGLPSGGHHCIPSPQVLWHHGKVSAKKGKEKKRRKHTFVVCIHRACMRRQG